MALQTRWTFPVHRRLWYFSNDDDCENGNTLTVVNGNENDVDFQNENNIDIKIMSYKTYKNENFLKKTKNNVNDYYHEN